MRVAVVSLEVYPFAKVGGLADVVGALPKALKRHGVEPIVIMPFHKIVQENARKANVEIKKVVDKVFLPKLKTNEAVSIYKGNLPNSDVPVYFIGNDKYFSAEMVYGGVDEAEQSIFFSNAVFETLKTLDIQVDVLHANDWQTGLVPVYLKTVYRYEPFFERTAMVYSIHNLGYQGIFDKRYLDFAKLGEWLYSMQYLEFYGNLNFMKGGIVFSDAINTVSPTYAKEIQTEEYGNKLDGVLVSKADVLFGILNGIDYSEYDPSKDPRISHHYSAEDYSNKWKVKEDLQKELGLEVIPDKPIFALISRLVDQKGLDILSEIIDYMLLYDVQFVLLGTGDPKYEKRFKGIASEYPGNTSINITFDVDLAQRIYAGSDFFLMPSLYEPCGLGQMYSMRYGTIPVVRYTGGLADTVKEYDPATGEGNGFGFKEYNSGELLKAITRALFYYRKKEAHERLIKNAMSTDVSWDKSAIEYIKFYKKSLEIAKGRF